MRSQRLFGACEARVIYGDVAALAPVHALRAEGGHDGLLNLRLAIFKCSALCRGFRLGQRLMKVGCLVILPMALELVVDDRAATAQYQQANNG